MTSPKQSSGRTSASDTDPQRRRTPRAFRLDASDVILQDTRADDTFAPRATARIVPEPEEPASRPLAPVRRKRRTAWGRVLATALGGLVALAIGLAIDGLIRDLFARNDWLGWTGLALAGLAAVALVALVLREVFGIMRLKRIDSIRDRLAAAAEADDAQAAKPALSELTALYEGRPETAQGRTAMRQHMREIIDGRDLVILTERTLLAPLDAQARRLVADAAKRVSVVTAISPRALIDLAYVAIENMRTIRRISDLYGGRPGTIGFLRLARNVLGHLAVTGGMAAGDSLAQQVLGHGLAARLSARLGEGVINGLLTARIGAAAIDVCRPAPFVGTKPPRMTDFIGELTSAVEKAEGSRETQSR